MIFSLLLCFFVISSSLGASSIRRIIPRAKVAAKRYLSVEKDPVKHSMVECTAFSKVNPFIADEEVFKRLIRGPLPVHLLLDPDYFTDAVNRGKHALCSQLLRNGQRIQLIDKDGNNLLVRIIELKMSYLIGILMETNRDSTMRALEVKDAKTGQTPFSMAAQQSDLIAILEIVNPRL